MSLTLYVGSLYSSRTGTHADTETQANQNANIDRFVYLRVFGSYSLCSLSAYLRIHAVVRAQIHIPNLALFIFFL